jgi:hypothetical protein
MVIRDRDQPRTRSILEPILEPFPPLFVRRSPGIRADNLFDIGMHGPDTTQRIALRAARLIFGRQKAGRVGARIQRLETRALFGKRVPSRSVWV